MIAGGNLRLDFSHIIYSALCFIKTAIIPACFPVSRVSVSNRRHSFIISLQKQTGMASTVFANHPPIRFEIRGYYSFSEKNFLCFA